MSGKWKGQGRREAKAEVARRAGEAEAKGQENAAQTPISKMASEMKEFDQFEWKKEFKNDRECFQIPSR